MLASTKDSIEPLLFTVFFLSSKPVFLGEQPRRSGSFVWLMHRLMADVGPVVTGEGEGEGDGPRPTGHRGVRT